MRDCDRLCVTQSEERGGFMWVSVMCCPADSWWHTESQTVGRLDVCSDWIQHVWRVCERSGSDWTSVPSRAHQRRLRRCSSAAAMFPSWPIFTSSSSSLSVLWRWRREINESSTETCSTVHSSQSEDENQTVELTWSTQILYCSKSTRVQVLKWKAYSM